MVEVLFSKSIHEEEAMFEALERVGIKPVRDFGADTKFVFNASVVQFPDVIRNSSRAPIINYVWDLYEWQVEGPESGYNWKGYIKFLEDYSHEIWVPNLGTQLRVKQYTGRDSKIVHCGIVPYEYPKWDGGWILDHMRNYDVPEHEWPKELGALHSNHGMEQDVFRSHVSGAKFLVTPYTEASTGGLTALEGLWNGIPSLVADGDYSGGLEYLGPYANTFKAGDKEDFIKRYKEMEENPPEVDIEMAREYIRRNFTLDTFAERIANEITHSDK